MSRPPITAAEIVVQLAERIEQLCATLLKNGHREGAEYRAGSTYGERGDSLGVRLKGVKRGVWCDFATGERGDALGLVKACLALSTADAITWSLRWLGMDREDVTRSLSDAARRRNKSAEIAEERAATLEIARRIWREGQPLAGTIGERYLRSRAIDLPTWPASLRFHPNLQLGPRRNGINYPAIVGAVQVPTREFRGVWRIYLRPNGTGKAPVENPRLGLGDIVTGALRLTPAAEEMVVGEGAETCLSVLVADPGRSVWAGLSASLMQRIELPQMVRRVLLLEENDPPDKRGRRASPDAVKALAARLLHEGREVRIVRMPAGFKDANDLLRGSMVAGDANVA